MVVTATQHAFNQIITTGSKQIQPCLVDILVADNSDKFHVD